MPQNLPHPNVTDRAVAMTHGIAVALFLYSIYGIGFGLLLAVVGAFTSFEMLCGAAAHILFGFSAVFQLFIIEPPTRTKHVALIATHAIVLGWGLAVVVNAASEGAIVAATLGAAIYLPLPTACICLLVSRPVHRIYWGNATRP